MSSDPRKSVEFVGEMPDDYEDEEYYGEEEEYAEDGEHDDYEEEEEAPAAAKPKSSVGRTALIGVTSVVFLGAIAFGAMYFLMPDALNDIANNLPFVSHADQPASDAATASAPGGKPGGAQKPGAATAPGGDVANVPPDPAKAGAMRPRRHKPPAAGGTEGTPPGENAASGAAPVAAAGKPPKPPRLPKPGAKPTNVAAAPNAAPMEGVPMEGVPSKPGKPAAKPGKPAAKPAAAPMTAHKPVAHVAANAKQMAAARAAWLKKHPHKAAAMAAVPGRGAFLGWGSRVVWVHGRKRRIWAPLYAVVPRRAATGHFPLAQHHTIAALPANWKHRPPSGHYSVQIGAFANSGNASQLVSQLRAQGIQAFTSPGKGRARVFVGSYPSRQAAAEKMQQLQSQGIPAAVTNQ